MGRFAVIREAGPGWDSSKPLRDQEAWPEHAAFMNALADEGFVEALGGPVGGGPKTLLIVDAPDEDAICRRLDADPSGRRWGCSRSPASSPGTCSS